MRKEDLKFLNELEEGLYANEGKLPFGAVKKFSNLLEKLNKNTVEIFNFNEVIELGKNKNIINEEVYYFEFEGLNFTQENKELYLVNVNNETINFSKDDYIFIENGDIKFYIKRK